MCRRTQPASEGLKGRGSLRSHTEQPPGHTQTTKGPSWMKLGRALIAARAVSSRQRCAEAKQERCERQSMCSAVPQRIALYTKGATSTQASGLRRAVISINSHRSTARGELNQHVRKKRKRDCWAELLSWHSSNSTRDNKPRVRQDLGTSRLQPRRGTCCCCQLCSHALAEKKGS